jgi:molybdopterin converting factor small subunit
MEVRLFATLRENRENTFQADWHEGLDGYALLKSLDIATEDAAIFLINGRHSRFDVPLSADDIIAIFPPVGGG